MKQHTIVFATIVILVLGYLAASKLYEEQRADELGTMAVEDMSLFSPPDAVAVGPEDARVQIVEFFDPACEACRAFYPHVKALLAEHPNDVRLVLRYVPLHQGSDVAVKILEAARRQDAYFPVLEMMLATQPQWADHGHPQPDRLWQFLPQTGVDVDRIRADVADPAIDAVLQRDIEAARILGVRKTPEFFVNGRPLPRFGLDQLQAMVASELSGSP